MDTSPAEQAPEPTSRRARHDIRTPDQRLRVFVSSTLRELADERAAARRAIESLRLTPVMFESGARPHPPRDLYRAYLAQSDVFVGIYGDRYGWVAPGEDVSGLEDEYRLSEGMPRLVYVRSASGPRAPELERLLERVRSDDRVSYSPFRTPEELAELLATDLAVLLSERFVRPAAAPAPEPARLPTVATSLVGRESLLDAAATLLRRPEVRLLTLYGPGGAGKSRVAVELAARLAAHFANDVSYVSLAAVRDPQLVASSLAIGLGVREALGDDPVGAMRRALADRAGLLLIDNFEHLLEAAPVVADLIQAAPRLTVLVTSRTVLRLSGEVVFPVPPLDMPPADSALGAEELVLHGAVRLFVERARAVDPAFVLDEGNAAAVVEICRRVDALPLAIELAAARVRALPPEALLARMTRRLPLLRGGPRDAPARQRTLRDTIEWSVALLGPGERTLLGRLSLFDGGASIETVERVLGVDDALLDDLTALVDSSLVQRSLHDDRVALLETVREYAAELLEYDAEAQALRERHARAYLDMAEAGARELRGAAQAQWRAWLRRDLANLRLAMTTLMDAGSLPEALRLATALRPLFMTSCHYEEGRRLLAVALEAAGEHHGRDRAAALLALATLTWRQGDLAASLPPMEESLAAYREVGDRTGAAAALRLLGVHAHNLGDYDLALERFEDALAIMRELGDDQGAASALIGIGNVAFDRGEARAAALYEESRRLSAGLGDALAGAYAIDNLGALAWCGGELELAERRTDEVARLYDELDHRFGKANVLHRRGLLALARAELVAAESYLEASLAIRTEIGETRGSAFILHDLGIVALEGGRQAQARERFRVGLELAGHHGAPLIGVLYLEGVAALCDPESERDAALELLAAAHAWRRRAGVPVCRVNRARHSELRRRLRGTLDAEAWAAAQRPAVPLSVAEGVARARALVEERAGGR